MGVAVIVLALLRAFVVETFTVTSDSMEPTLAQGDRLLVLKPGAPERDDLIVFDGTTLLGASTQDRNPVGDALARLLGSDPAAAYVKRVVAVAGDHLVCCDAEGRLALNGEPLDEPYLVGATDQVTFDVTLPDGRLWVMGDNRADSADSRSALGRPGGGMLRADDVIGTVVWQYWPWHGADDTAVGPMGDTSQGWVRVPPGVSLPSAVHREESSP